MDRTQVKKSKEGKEFFYKYYIIDLKLGNLTQSDNRYSIEGLLSTEQNLTAITLCTFCSSLF